MSHSFTVRLRFAVLAVFLLIFAGPVAFAQSSYGTIAGTVIDKTGAAIVGATVTATETQTNVSRTVTTNKSGGYRIDTVQGGIYKVVVTSPSFATTTVDHAEVSASLITSVNVTLTVGASSSTIEVTTENSALRTDSGELSDTLAAVEINNLPISNLNPYSLATLLPGVTVITASDLTNPGNFSVNGNRPRDNNFLIEGVDNNDQGIHGQAFQPENIEAVQEISFLLDSFSAEYGRGGSVSNLIFQSGTNAFHGAVYERLLNSALDSTDHSTVLNLQAGGTNGKEKTRQNLFGFRIGGPIFHDKAFFFVSNQWDRSRSTANLGVLTVPTASGYTALKAYAAANPSNVRVANLLKAYGGLVGTNQNYAVTESLGPGLANVDFAGVQRTLGKSANSRELEATTDVVLSSADKLRLRFIQAPYLAPYDVDNFPDQLPGFDSGQDGTTYNAGIIETHVFSPNLLNELRLSWSRIGFTFSLRPDTLSNPLATQQSIGIDQITGYGVPSGVPQGRFQNTYQLQDAVTYTKGRHSFKVGFDVADIRIKDSIPFNFYGSVAYTASPGTAANNHVAYSALANYVDDFAGNGNSTAGISFGNPTAYPEIWTQNYYAQDTWKVMPNLTFDLGIRYEYNGTPFNYLGYPGFNTANPTLFPSKVSQIGDKNNFAPRVGFNYSPKENGKTVISGAFGVFYSHVFSNIIDNIQGSAPNTAAKDIVTDTTLPRGTPNYSTVLAAISDRTPLATDTVNGIIPHLLDPLTYEYNLRIQRELPDAIVLAIQYVGNRSEHEYATEEYNPTTPAGPRVIKSRGRIVLEDNAADSNYNSLEAELQHKLAHGLELRASYTYSKLLDDGSEIFTDAGNNGSTYAEIDNIPRAREYGPSQFDHRHRFVVSAVYKLPTWHAEGGMKIASAIVNGFTLSGVNSFQSGNPENVEIGYDWNFDGISNDRPILLNKNAPIGNWAVKGDDPSFGLGMAPGTLCDGPRFWATNDDCQVVTAANTHWVTSTFGTTQNTISRNSLVSDHVVNTDLSLQRAFKTFEHQSFDFRVEALNAFNQGNSGSANTTLITGNAFNGTSTASGEVFNGTNTFAQGYPTVNGRRSIRIYARYQF